MKSVKIGCVVLVGLCALHFFFAASAQTKNAGMQPQPILWLVVLCVVLGAFCVASYVLLELKCKKEHERQQMYRAITEQALRTMAKTIDAKDANTNGHSIRVADISRKIAQRMQLSEEEIESIYYAALLHDIGKIGVPDSILLKPGKLTEEEFSTMQQHTSLGYEILKDFTTMPAIAEGALLHHERYGGGGYPLQATAREIPIAAQIICVADAYDAMATMRSYKPMQNTGYIINELKTCSGTQFSPTIASILLDILQEERAAQAAAESNP